MTKLEIRGQDLIVEVLGLDKLWSFKSSLTIPLAHIVDVQPGADAHLGWDALRAPGTAIPWLFVAGTFYTGEGKQFWDVAQKSRSIALTLRDESYRKLVIEVEDRDAAIELVRSAIVGRDAGVPVT